MSQIRYAIVCPARWEAESICEWLLYHRSIGFDHAYIYCNDDDPNELFDRTAVFRKGPKPFVTFVHYPFVGLQWDIYLHWFRNYSSQVDWIAFLDADEFLVLPGVNNINAFVARFPDDCNAIHYHWLFYGTNSFLTRPDGSILRQYTRRARGVSYETKTMIRARQVDPDSLRPEQLPFWHLWTVMHVPNICAYTSFGLNITEGYDRELHSRESNEAILSSGFVAHFALRSEADFIRRLERGTAGQFSGQGMWASQLASGEAYAFIDHTNEVEDFYLRDLWHSMSGQVERTRLIERVLDLDLARNRACLQSSAPGPGADSNLAMAASKAVSGIITGRANVQTAAELNPWWQVDLGELRRVGRLRMTTRTDNRAAAASMSPMVVETSVDCSEWTQRFRQVEPRLFGGADGNPLMIVFDGVVSARYVRISIQGEAEIALDQIEVYGPSLAEHRVSVVSFYMSNIPASVVHAQAAIVKKFLPAGFAFHQIKTSQSHYEALDNYMQECDDGVFIFIDIDCVPLHSSALSEMASLALQEQLVGCVQRASHIENDSHLYAGPFCLALTKQLWQKLGSPSFVHTNLGDVGEQLTYVCEAIGVPVVFIWPSRVEDARWPLTDATWFGLNTEYGEAFFHAFSIREEGNRQKFLEYCRRLSSEPDRRKSILWDVGKSNDLRSLKAAQNVEGTSQVQPVDSGSNSRQISHDFIEELRNADANLHLAHIRREVDINLMSDMGKGYHAYGNEWWRNLECPYSFKYISLDTLYPEQYFEPEIGHPSDAAASDLYRYMQQVYSFLFGRKFSSVIELGTGGGEITTAFAKDGLDYLAVEGSTAGVDTLVARGIDPERIRKFNLKFMPRLERRFDLAMCTEVIEHIEPFFASKIVDNCISHSDAIWFSAADRNRPAHYHHVNEQPIEVWDNLFAYMGYSWSVHLNGMMERAARLYLSDRIGSALVEKFS
ncbi:MAG TPA: glycosyltransferase family 2 protein [Acidisoma sp.]|jgi:hypothetical protein|uniref:glycosyltransferase family 2 protein n=1 Tax=Acidisoma sp. TaxID=1872115 RepID=UPI002B6BA1E2|nr:glycosyltransferase family 2 protein [Acidisoma sp.]HTI03664.1 glycosyltransferase family 2 protein [Acidisoma sp.]